MSVPIKTNLVAAFLLTYLNGEIKVLLMQRSRTEKIAPLTWQIIYGHVLDAETGVDAVIREIREETGILIQELYSTNEVLSFYDVRDNVIVMVPVFAGIIKSEDEVKMNAEHGQHQWVDLKTAHELLMFPAQRRLLHVIDELFNNKVPPEILRVKSNANST